jgi:Putative zinc-finger
MEHAPLRPVPARPAGPIDPATAIREVGAWLPTVTPAAARAFALVVLAERPRPEAAASLGVSEGELGELLASARKELRQGIVTLGGSGWCERAEGLISDRLDGALAEGDVRRLDVHLRNCARCVEHERRLVQATDAVVGALGGRATPAGGGASATPLVEAPEEAPSVEGPPDGEALKKGAPSQEAPPEEAPPVGAPPVEAPPEDLPPGDDAPEEAPAPAAATSAEIAAAAEVLVAVRTRRQIAAAVVWNAMIVLAVLLAVAAIALTVAGILGAKL